MGEYMLKINNLCKTFGITKANDDVSLKLEPGKVHALAGRMDPGNRRWSRRS